MTDKLFKAYSRLCATQVRFCIYYYYSTHLPWRSGLTAGALLGMCDGRESCHTWVVFSCLVVFYIRAGQTVLWLPESWVQVTWISLLNWQEYFHLLSQVPAICHATDKNHMWRPAMLKHISSHVWPHENHLGLWWSTYRHMCDHMKST